MSSCANGSEKWSISSPKRLSRRSNDMGGGLGCWKRGDTDGRACEPESDGLARRKAEGEGILLYSSGRSGRSSKPLNTDEKEGKVNATCLPASNAELQGKLSVKLVALA